MPHASPLHKHGKHMEYVVTDIDGAAYRIYMTRQADLANWATQIFSFLATNGAHRLDP